MKIPNPVGQTANELQEQWIKELRAMADTNTRLQKMVNERDQTIRDLRVRLVELVAR